MTRRAQCPAFLVSALVVMLLLVPTASAGQEPATSSLPIGLRVRVLAVDSTVVWGRLEAQTQDAFVLLQSDETEPIVLARENVLRMWRRDGDHHMLGLYIGGGVGVVIGVIYMLGRPSYDFSKDFAPPVGGVLGAGAGMAIGAFVTKWVPVPF